MTTPPLEDDVARRLLPFPLSLLPPTSLETSSAMEVSSRRLAQALLRLSSGGLVDQLALRSLAIDREVEAALSGGVDQLILLGAGLDARAYRMKGLEDTRVFEVDHPTTQRYKRQRATGLEPRAREVIYAPCDFGRDRLSLSLAHVGHRAGERSAWIWEGVTMYLPLPAVRATLREMAECSAPGSLVAVTYMIRERGRGSPLLRAGADAVLSVLGEPLGAAFTPEEIAALLAEHGFDRTLDASNVEWAEAFEGNSLLPFLFRRERLAIAIRR